MIQKKTCIEVALQINQETIPPLANSEALTLTSLHLILLRAPHPPTEFTGYGPRSKRYSESLCPVEEHFLLLFFVDRWVDKQRAMESPFVPIHSEGYLWDVSIVDPERLTLGAARSTTPVTPPLFAPPNQHLQLIFSSI